ncbi:MAG TPA: prephenate dehydratase domain-containing protein [Gemmatimonadaceae bacterium]|jgi:prephenate dehydratase|nr:prephenate dehydratase domain-containing protein [Gemmatimonadaceae bacterium]
MQQRRIAVQGAAGAYGEEAVRQLFGDDATAVPFRETTHVARAVAREDVDAGVLPIENTLAGSVHASYDAIVAEPAIHAVDDVVIRIRHCLLAPAGARLESMSIVESHPVALAQCTMFFTEHPWLEARAAYNTAGAAADAAASNDPRRGAIASRSAASLYGLEILAANIEDRDDNQTRFLLLSRSPAALAIGAFARTLLVVTTDDRPGALLRLLVPLAERDLNLVKLESRPTGEPWTYRFILEFEHDADDASARDAVAAIAAASRQCRHVGTYRTDVRVANVSPSPSSRGGARA